MAASLLQKPRLFCIVSINNVFKTSYSSIRVKNHNKESRTMQRLLNKANRKKDKRWFTPIFEQNNAVTFCGPAKSKQKFSAGMIRRANCIGDVLYEAISQIISSGQIGTIVTVTQVKVLPDMSHMNIYWEASGVQEADKQTQAALDQKAKFLRHILIETQAAGSVPRPVFVKDISTAAQKQVTELLHRISIENQKEQDSLEESTDSPSVISQDSNVRQDLSETNSESDTYLEQQKIDEKFEKVSHVHGRNDQDLQNMQEDFRQDMYDLQHDVLMKKVVSAKVSAIQRPSVVSDAYRVGDNYIKYEDNFRTKFIPPKKQNKKKLLRQIERESNDRSEYDMNMSDDIDDSDETIDDDLDEESSIDRYMEQLYKKSRSEDSKPE